MDIFSHGLWAGVAYKAINKKSQKPLNVWLAGFWGVFPDLFAFTIPFIWTFWNLIFGGLSLANLPRPDTGEPPAVGEFPVFRLASSLYNISHSAVIFFAIFGFTALAVFLRNKRVLSDGSPVAGIWRMPWELGGWIIHVLLDIPTHSYQFYPTPFLWPLSGWTFDGFSWVTLWFLIPNYIAIIAVYLLLRKKSRSASGGKKPNTAT